MSDYECAVYKDETDDLARAITDLIEERTVGIADTRVRKAIVAAATLTALQLLDGSDIERDRPINPEGFAGTLADCISMSRSRWGQ